MLKHSYTVHISNQYTYKCLYNYSKEIFLWLFVDGLKSNQLIWWNLFISNKRGHASIIPWIRNMYLDIMVMKYIFQLDENIKFVMILKKKKVRAHLNWSRQLLRIKWYLATLVVCYIALSLYVILRLGKNLHSTHLDPIRLTISLCINTSVNTITRLLPLEAAASNIERLCHFVSRMALIEPIKSPQNSCNYPYMECNCICTHASASGICVSFQSIRDCKKVQKCVGDLSDQIKANNTATKNVGFCSLL